MPNTDYFCKINLARICFLKTNVFNFNSALVKNEAVSSRAIKYMNIKSFSYPFLLMQFALSGTYRGLQDTRTPFLMALIASLTNFGLVNLFLSMGMGVEGSAYAITIAEVISSTGMLLILFRR